MRPTFSAGLSFIEGVGWFRSHERYLANGQRDTSRCRYFINGRKVKHARYMRALWPKREKVRKNAISLALETP